MAVTHKRRKRAVYFERNWTRCDRWVYAVFASWFWNDVTCKNCLRLKPKRKRVPV